MTDQQRTYTLGGIFDSQAKAEVEYTLSEMKNIKDVQVDLDSKQVSFQFDPNKIEETFIQNTLNSLGYSIQGD